MYKVRMVIVVPPQGLVGELGDNLGKVLNNVCYYYFFSLCTWQVVNILSAETLHFPHSSNPWRTPPLTDDDLQIATQGRNLLKSISQTHQKA